MKYFLAVDIGASSGRHIIGYEKDGELILDEVYRFKNYMDEVDSHLIWDIDRLSREVINGIKEAFKKYKKIESLSIDTWGVDYVLMNKNTPIYPCYAYRDSRTEDIIEKVHSLVPFENLYESTGIQFQKFNTIYQLYDDLLKGRLEKSDSFLMIPEYLNFVLTGVKKKEYTNATTTGLVNSLSRTFDDKITKKLFPSFNLGKLSNPGEVVGKLKEEIAKEVNGQLDVVLCCSHDTASAVESVPYKEHSAYISSGTWSLIGVRKKEALTDKKSMKENWSNEGGKGYFRYQKNIMGLWIVQNLREELCSELSFADAVKLAEKSTFEGYFDADDPSLLAPKSMKDAISKLLNRYDLSVGDYFRSAYLSLAKCYKKALKELSENIGEEIKYLYIVGGGAKNALLNEMTRKECEIEVIALPIEATSYGNLKVQIERGK